MTKRIYALMLISLLMASCTKSEPTYEMLISDTPVSFDAQELTADWGTKSLTRGVAIDDITDVESIMVYAFLNDSDSEICYIDNEEATLGSDNLWGFTPAHYYPYDYTLDFLAYTPAAHLESTSDNNGLTQTLDFENKAIKFSYSAPTTGRNQPDLMLATPQTGCYIDNQLENLPLNHALTQVTMSAKVGADTEEGRYVITRFTMHDITIAADMTYSTAAIGDWTETSNGEFITSAMLPNSSIEISEGVYEDPVELTADYQDIMSNGQSLFMIPQAIEGKEGTAPTIQITITDTQEGSELVYRTDKLTLPSPDSEGWIMGQHVNLQFEFDIDENDIVIPLSFTAKLLDWIDTTVDKEIDASIYAYLSTNSVTYGEAITLYTNGVVEKVTLIDSDGNETTPTYTSTDNGYSIAITSSSGGYTLEVCIANSDDTTITKRFTITILEE